MSIAYGTYMSPPSARPTPSASTVLPLPGGPYRKIDLPEFTAGPSWSIISRRHDEVREAVGEPLAIQEPAAVADEPHVVAGTARAAPAPGRRTGWRPRSCSRALAAEVCQRVPVAGAAVPGRAAHLDELLDAHVLDDLLEHRVRQAQLVGEHEPAGLARVERLDEQVAELLERQPGGLNRRGRVGHRRRAFDGGSCDLTHRRPHVCM